MERPKTEDEAQSPLGSAKSTVDPRLRRHQAAVSLVLVGHEADREGPRRPRIQKQKSECLTPSRSVQSRPLGRLDNMRFLLCIGRLNRLPLLAAGSSGGRWDRSKSEVQKTVRTADRETQPAGRVSAGKRILMQSLLQKTNRRTHDPNMQNARREGPEESRDIRRKTPSRI